MQEGWTDAVLLDGKTGENSIRERSSKAAGKLNAAATEQEKQLVLAKATGNFKRGNEREGKTG